MFLILSLEAEVIKEEQTEEIELLERTFIGYRYNTRTQEYIASNGQDMEYSVLSTHLILGTYLNNSNRTYIVIDSKNGMGLHHDLFIINKSSGEYMKHKHGLYVGFSFTHLSYDQEYSGTPNTGENAYMDIHDRAWNYGIKFGYTYKIRDEVEFDIGFNRTKTTGFDYYQNVDYDDFYVGINYFFNSWTHKK